MAKNLKSITASAAVAAPPTDAALEQIKAQFTPERWGKITRQACNSCALDAEGLQALCTQLLHTRTARHPGNAPAALYAACNGLLLAIGSSTNAHDCSRFETALQTGQTSPLPMDEPTSPPPPTPEAAPVPESAPAPESAPLTSA